jgi:hypothetical protein
MYTMVEEVPQLEHDVELKYPSKAAMHAMREFESQWGFSTKAHRVWRGHSAAPTLAVAGRNKISQQQAVQNQKQSPSLF